ncbi:MAG TPA: AIR synthase [Clostridiales bacterium]|nr:AIR synthase [Clostridiales bacterium]
MKSGKLNNELLKSIVFNNITYQREEIMVRAGIGEDCAVIDFGEFACVISTDPITGASNKVGRLAVHIACNDIASNGVEPLGLLLTLLVPEGTTEAELNEIMKEAGEAAAELNVEIMGGHTEVTSAVNKIIISATVIGKHPKNKVIFSKGAQPGDLVIMTKSAGLEGTAIIAHDWEDRLRKDLGDSIVEEGKKMMQDISVVKEGVIAGKIGVTAMHDATEGGLLGALWELCEASKVGTLIDREKINIAPVTKEICQYFNLDPLRLISSGCMLITVAQEKAPELLNEYKKNGIVATIIGKVTASGRFMQDGENLLEILPPIGDELYKVF